MGESQNLELFRAQILDSSQTLGPREAHPGYLVGTVLPREIQRETPWSCSISNPSPLLRMLSGFWGSQAGLGTEPLLESPRRTSLVLP